MLWLYNSIWFMKKLLTLIISNEYVKVDSKIVYLECATRQANELFL